MSKKHSLGSVKNLGNGKYLLRVSANYDDFGNRVQIKRTVTAKSDREAEQQLLVLYTERDKIKGNNISDAPKTLGELHDEWVKNHVSINLRKSTATYYSDIWKNHLKQFEKTRLKSITPKIIYKMLEGLSDIPRTRKAVYRTLSAMFSQAVKWGYMSENTCVRVDVPKYTAEEKIAFTREEIANIISTIANEKVMYQALFYFAILCGMRRGEIVGLMWDDIDFENMSFEIKRAATQQKGIGTFTDLTKNKKSMRKLSLPQRLVPILKELRVDQLEQKLKLGGKWNDEGFIFTAWDGKIMSVATPTFWWCHLRKDHPDFPKQNFHVLRHTLATYMILDNIPVSTVSGILGHSSISITTNTYTHVIEDSKKEAMQSYEGNILGTKWG